jgi:site-specific DNA-methyltransferase (adenine-specific)
LKTRGRARPTDLPTLVWPGKPEVDVDATAPSALEPIEIVGGPRGDGLLALGDNAASLRALAATHAGKVDLAYLDPPFATGAEFLFSTRGNDADHVAYSDGHVGGAYLSALLVRLRLVRALLADTGSVFVHCDWHASHWIRCLLDEVFGADAFKNEIVWRYRRWPAKTRVFQRMHDVIFWYGKRADDAHAWSPQFEALAASTVATWGTKKQVADFSSGRRKPSQTDEETRGAPMSDVWEIGIVAPIAKERVGYPTQKPLALLERIVEAASKPGDLVLDPFMGSGTTLVAAHARGRRFMGCDASPLAVHTAKKRLLAAGARGFSIARCSSAGRVIEDGALDGPRVEATAERDLFGVVRAVDLRAEGAPVTGSVRVRGRLRDAAWTDALDYWAVGAADAAAPFESLWHAFRATPTSDLAVRAEIDPEAARSGPLVVQLVDALGRERRVRVA